jgi:hypothetical protein
MTQENIVIIKGVLQAYSEKNGGLLIENKWYNGHGIDAAVLAGLKRKRITAELSADGRTVTKLELDAAAQSAMPAPRRMGGYGGRSEEDSRRITRQACLNTATAIYDLAIKTSAGGFSSPQAAAPADVAQAIKTEVMRIAKDLEDYVYR